MFYKILEWLKKSWKFIGQNKVLEPCNRFILDFTTFINILIFSINISMFLFQTTIDWLISGMTTSAVFHGGKKTNSKLVLWILLDDIIVAVFDWKLFLMLD